MPALPAVPAQARHTRGHGLGGPVIRAADLRPTRLAAQIGQIRQRLASSDTLRHPRVLAELHELYRQVAADLDHGRGRHRMPAPGAAAPGAATARRGIGPCPPDAEPVPDASGIDLRPDPLAATTGAELVDALRRYRQWAGDPSFRAMAAQAGQQVAHTTMYSALAGTSLPKLRVVLAVVAGCGGGHDDQRAFASAWRQIKAGDVTAGLGARAAGSRQGDVPELSLCASQ